jgi:GNAT superfamily N-acetyltransferase
MDIKFRAVVRNDDAAKVREIVRSTGFFNDAEIEVAVELVDERLAKGLESGYFFIFAEVEGQTVGYVCYGPIPATAGSYDLYWIAVYEGQQGKGLGRLLLEKTEQAVKTMKGTRIYIETSSRKKYLPTRIFYENNGYKLEAVLEEFYAPDDSKCIYVKALNSNFNIPLVS